MEIENTCKNIQPTENTTGNGSDKDTVATLELVEAEVKRLGIADPERDPLEFRTAVIVLAAALIGTNVADLARFTGYEVAFVLGISQRMLKAGLWTKTECTVDHWLSAESEVLAFMLDVLVAEGLLEARLMDNGEFGYRQVPPN